MENNPFAQEWLDCLIADYAKAVQNKDMPQEASLKFIMLDAGISLETVEDAKQIAVENSQVYSDESIAEYLERLEQNLYIPHTNEKHKKAKKGNKDNEDLLSGGSIRNIWTETDTYQPPTKNNKHVVQPDLRLDIDCVHIKGSKLIHYAKPGRKSTLCGKKIEAPANMNEITDPVNRAMYSICPKCKTYE